MALGCSRIVWFNGGVSCGRHSDIVLARSAFVDILDPGEMACADSGYSDRSVNFITPFPKNTTDAEERRYNRVHSLIMSRHENVNARLKAFSSLSHQSRHCRHIGDGEHFQIFSAVVQIVQLLLEDEPLQELQILN